MQFLRLADVPPQQSEQLFAYSRLRAISGATLTAGFIFAAFLFSWINGAWPGYIIGSVLLVMLLIFHKLVTARFRSSNWLVRATNDGLFIKFRSYLNGHFDDRDLTVVFVPYSEIRSATLVRETRELPDRDGASHNRTTRSARRLIELELTADCTPLSKLLANELERIFGKEVVGAGKISTRYQHFPVRLAPSKRLRIEWGVVPGPQTLLDILARHSIPQRSTEVVEDFNSLEKLPKAQQEERLLQLIEGGDKLGAIALARRLYACDLAAAKQFIEELAQRQPPSADPT